MARDIENAKIDPDAIAEMSHAIVFEGYTVKDFARISDDEMEAAYAVAFSLVNQGQYDEAEKLLSWLAGLDQFEAKYQLGIGLCRQQMGRLEGAIQAFATVGILDATNPIAPLRAAECYLQLGKLEEARSGLRAAQHWASGRAEHAAIGERARVLLDSLERKEA